MTSSEKQTALKKILCIGNVSVDIKAYSPEEDENESYRDGTIELVPGGVGRGMAVNLKHLGFNSYIFSVVGEDIFGRYLKDGLDNENVNTSLLRRSSTHKTALFSVMASVNKRASCIYNTSILKEIVLDQTALDVIKQENIRIFVMDSNLNEETLKAFYDLKKADPDIFIFQNATSPDIARKTLDFAPLMDLFAANEFEAQAILGETPIPDISTADKMQQLGFKNFIITFGNRGVMVRIGNETWIEPPYKPSFIADTIGAGDAFASGFLTGYLEKLNIRQCIHYGLACAKETLLTKQTVSSKLSRDFLDSI